MLCSSCNIPKLRREFPAEGVCSNKHIELICLRCITQCVEDNNSCPVCDEEIPEDNKQYRACIAKLNWLFPQLNVEEEQSASSLEDRDASSRGTVRVVMLGGESHTIPFNSSLQVKDFKTFVKQKFGVEDEMQKLLYQEKILESYEAFKTKTMGDYGIQADSTIQLVKILQTLSQSIEHVIFDFSWGFPSSYNRDYLDASALLYSGGTFLEYVDFRNRSSRQAYGAVTHSGCISDGISDRGRHRMNILLNALPIHIDKVFFTLSSWRSPSIANYKSPRLQFYDVRCPGRQLCSEEFDRAINSQAVIMCSVCRVNGRWKVYSLGQPSNGNVMRERYCYLQGTIENIIRRGIC